MTLIKCSECDKIYSDKATNCPVCSCPTEYSLVNEKRDKKEIRNDVNQDINNKEVDIIKEIEIMCAEFDFKYINIISLVIKLLIIPFIVYRTFMIFSINKSIISIDLITIVFLIFMFWLSAMVKRSKKNVLVVTNKRICGKINNIISTNEINFPLNKISSLIITKMLGIKTLMIEVSSSTKYRVTYIKNAEEIKNKLLELIEKNNK